MHSISTQTENCRVNKDVDILGVEIKRLGFHSKL